MKKSAPQNTVLGLPRSFGFWTGWFVVIASMVGSGILTNSGPILKSTGSYWALLLTWGLGGILSLIGALTLGEVASSYPQAGGDYTYVRMALGSAFGFVFGWSMVVIGFGAPIALVAYATANYLYPFAQGMGWAVPERFFVLGLATFLVSVFTFSHCLGHRSSSRVQSATTFFNFLLLGSFAVGCLLFGRGDWDNFRQGTALTSVSAPSWGINLIRALYAYTGWNAATYLAGEVKNPQRNLPLTLGLGCLAVTFLYLLINVTYCFAISPQTLAALSSDELNRLAEVSMTRLFNPEAARVFSFLVSMGMLAALSAFILTGPRIVYAMARDGLFPAWAGRLHPGSQVPREAILAQGVLALVFLWSGTFDQVLNFAGYGLAVVGIFTVASVFWLRRRSDYRPSFRIPLYPWAPLAFLGISVASLVTSFVDDPKTSCLSLGCILMGFPLYWSLKKIGVKQLA